MERTRATGNEAARGPRGEAAKPRPGRRVRWHPRLTLTDVLLAGALIALTAAIALPGRRDSSLYSRRDEALNALTRISELQNDFFSEHGRYSESYSELGLSLRGSRLNGSVQGENYVFELTTWERDGRPSGNYRATATGNLDPRDEILDIVIIGNELPVEGEELNTTTPVILSDDISKTLTRAASLSSDGATGFRREMAASE
jgi:type II secretory pathway pseudopilin PulG